MNTSEAQLQLMLPAWPLMWYVEHQYERVEDGRETLDYALSWIRAANQNIENTVVADDLRFAMLDRPEGDDRYRMKHFLS